MSLPRFLEFMSNANTKRDLILASASRRRQRILKNLGLKFKVLKSNLKEDNLIKEFKKLGYKNLVKILAFSKAFSVYLSHITKLQGNEIIVGFDTIVVCKDKIIGKPKNKNDALKKLLFLSDKKHKVFTGICLIDLKREKITTNFESTKISMGKIGENEARAYINTKEPMDKAGAYAIQGKGRKFIKHISGSYFNVVGLPIAKFLLMLKGLN